MSKHQRKVLHRVCAPAYVRDSARGAVESAGESRVKMRGQLVERHDHVRALLGRCGQCAGEIQQPMTQK